MGSTSLVTSLNITTTGFVGASAVASIGAYSGGTGQLVPIGHTGIWWDDVLPTEGGYAWANGTAISRTANPILWARWGTRYGAGDGITTFNVPDLRDTVGIGKSTMGGVASRGLQTLTNTVLGTLIGLANNVLVALNIPTITSVNAAQAITVSTSSGVTLPSTSSGWDPIVINQGINYQGLYCPGGVFSITSLSGNNSISTTYTNSSQTAVNNVQPSTTCNYIIRIG